LKILFISHNAQPAGAQLLLLRFLKWLKIHHPEESFDILLMKGGVLLDDFRQLSICYIYPNNSRSKNILVQYNIRRKQKRLLKQLKANRYDLIYSNTILNGFVLKELSFLNLPVITHAHEMDYWIQKLSANELSFLKTYTNYFFTASEAVSEALIRNDIGERNKMFPVYVFIEPDQLLDIRNQKSLKEYLKLPEDAIIIGACGAENFRKGKDWFVPVANGVLSKLSNNQIHFVWIGGRLEEEIQFDCERSAYQSQIHFIDHLPDAAHYFHEFSLFMMLSREDPFPTVNLEVGIHGIPIICFENAGGTPELLADQPDLMVPYGNISLMTERIISLLSNPDQLHNKGTQLQSLIKSRYLISRVAEDIYRKMEELVNGGG
jgi:glycosyltransferase involved in cell wall biosynthesis